MDEIEIQEGENQIDTDSNLTKPVYSGSDFLSKTTHISGMYQNWFLDYASYVILERAVPHILDGLKPVQRRILHAMKELDDGRYNKVANIVGHTMQYHPHGDASIGDALVQMGQKELLIDCQGNWGNTLTGDSAAAPRYIEARLSKFALDVVFNPKTTAWQRSYDGRKKEPIALPVKFPLLLTQGTEGIAVGLACKIFPHNFNELINASVNILKDKPFEIFPDFLTGGLADCSRYNNGLRGGRIRVRARIKQVDKKTLAITEIPFGMTTDMLIESIVKANESGKIKIRKIDDNTAAEVEIVIHLAPNVSPDQTIDALYAFTNCEISIAPNACVIIDNKPVFMSAPDILRYNTLQTKDLLKRELEIRLKELEEDWHYSSLERIFFEYRIYKELEKDQDTWEEQLLSIEKSFDSFLKILKRSVTREDILRLTEKPVRRISKFDLKKADEHIKNVENEMETIQNNLNHLIEYAIDYFLRIKKDYGKNRERKTELRNFDNIEAARVVVNNEKLYFDRAEGFSGTSLKKAEYLCDCSDMDEVIIFLADGTYKITKVSPKFFVGTNVIHIAIFQRNNERTIYNAIYQDGKNGNNYVKRFAATGLIRDKEYNLTKGAKGSMVHYFTANPNGEAEVVRVLLRPKPKLRRTSFDFDFSIVAIKSRSSQGNIISKNPIKKVLLKEDGISTLGAVNIYYDDTVRRLNGDERGQLLGAFKSDDKILTMMNSGEMKFYGYDLSSHFEEDMIIIEKFDPDDIITAVYYDGESKKIFIKRFVVDQPQLMKKISFISEAPNSKLLLVTLTPCPQIELVFDEKKNKKFIENEIIAAEDFIDIKSMKAKGKQLSKFEIKTVKELEPLSDLSIDDEKDEDIFESEEIEENEEFEVLPFENEEKPEDDKIETIEESKTFIINDLELEPKETPDSNFSTSQPQESQKTIAEQEPELSHQEQSVKQNADEIPFEIVIPDKKKTPKKKPDNDGQMRLF